VIRAEQYIKYFNKKLRDHQLGDLEVYLDELGGNISLKDWQIRQSVDAIRILLCDIYSHDWACAFDWESWLGSLKRLPDTHVTVARDYDQSTLTVVESSGTDEETTGFGLSKT